MGSVGRPKKQNAAGDSRERLVRAAVEIIQSEGAAAVTVRRVCETAGLSTGTFYHFFQNKDDLLMEFVRQGSFDTVELTTPLTSLADRVCELYLHLIRQYRTLGLAFVRSFYSTENQALSAYLGAQEGSFPPGTAMARCEREIAAAIHAGVLPKGTDAHTLSMDVCTIVKGCVFEWALTGGTMDLEQTLRRIVGGYLRH